ncbi:hypothetical protein LCGC14_0194250 [marine sediment metagenome]|uniref:Uncharacterized protein n=1 Tax=marine sediment metagenome TaxID=412755 RepID=A0A0F9X509_9ZZZZ|nr:hypothetical protein [Halomonas sp.]HDZ45496.1 hypothetical protein [Halomonas sp.]
MNSSMNTNYSDEIYKILYNKINNQYDIRNPILAHLVRDCVNNFGVIPSSKFKEIADLQYGRIIEDIQNEYFNIKASFKNV